VIHLLEFALLGGGFGGDRGRELKCPGNGKYLVTKVTCPEYSSRNSSTSG
jgi:hypothetical protein